VYLATLDDPGQRSFLLLKAKKKIWVERKAKICKLPKIVPPHGDELRPGFATWRAETSPIGVTTPTDVMSG
jgi:hypothetical protein